MLHSGKKAAEWNRVVPNDQLDSEMDSLLQLLKSKNQQGMRQLKFIINRGVECDLYTTQCFEVLSAGLTGAVNGMWEIEDVDKVKGVIGFYDKDGLWQTRRRMAKDFWVK